MEMRNNSKNEQNFELILTKILNGQCNETEEEQFLEEYIWTENPEDFHYVKMAADHGFVKAYAPLADRYSTGNGCSENWGNAFQYWTLAVQNGQRGYAGIGDCYRLGKGVNKDYDKAWAAYEMAQKTGDDLNDLPPPKLLLLDNACSAIEQKEIELDWLKYAVKKQTCELPAYIYGTIATAYFEWGSDDFLHWTKLGADAGDVGAKCIIFRYTDDSAYKGKLVREIFHAKDYSGGNDDAAIELAKKIVDDKNYEAQAVRFLDECGEFSWLSEHYREQNRLDDLQYILEESNDVFSFDEIPDGHFKCSCCGRIFSIDDQNDSDAQGECCDDCYFSGKCLQ